MVKEVKSTKKNTKSTTSGKPEAKKGDRVVDKKQKLGTIKKYCFECIFKQKAHRVESSCKYCKDWTAPRRASHWNCVSSTDFDHCYYDDEDTHKCICFVCGKTGEIFANSARWGRFPKWAWPRFSGANRRYPNGMTKYSTMNFRSDNLPLDFPDGI